MTPIENSRLRTRIARAIAQVGHDATRSRQAIGIAAF
jgi:hypothetical protein